MKHYKFTLFATLFCIGALFTACIQNNSALGGQPISLITFPDSLKTGYSVDKFDTLVVDAPRLVQANQDKSLSYEWEVNYKKVGTEKTLKYVCQTLGTFPCRLKVSNEDGAIFYTFNLIVKSPYQEGVMVMSSYKNKSMFSFKREDIEGKRFYKHVYEDNNPKIPLGAAPLAVVQHNKMLYFASNNPAKMVKVDEKTMEAMLVFDYDQDKVGGIVAPKYVLGLTVMNNGICYDYDSQQDAFMNFTWPAIRRAAPNAKLSDKMVYVMDAGFTEYPYFYDNNGCQLFTLIRYQVKKVEDARFQGKELVSMMPCNSEKDILLVLKDKATSDLYLAHYIHETFTVQSMKKLPIKAPDKSFVAIASQKDPVFYYCVGNNVYAHNYLAENFSATPQYTLGKEGDNVAALLFNPLQTKLYIGLNRKAGGDYSGDVFCFDNAKQKELWHESGVAGDIVFMGFKQ